MNAFKKFGVAKHLYPHELEARPDARIYTRDLMTRELGEKIVHYLSGWMGQVSIEWYEIEMDRFGNKVLEIKAVATAKRAKRTG